MAQFPNFIGGTYLDASLVVDAEDCQNWVPELVESAGGRNKYVLRRTPGTEIFATLPGGAQTLAAISAGEQVIYAVAKALHSVDAVYYGIGSGGGVTTLGTLTCAGNADIAYNGNQVLIASDGFAWVDNGSSLVPACFNDPWTDLALTAGGGGLEVSSASNPFTQADVGLGIYVTGGSGFTAGAIAIVSSVSGAIATLSISIGTAGSTGGQAGQIVPAVRCAYLDGYFWAQAGGIGGNANTPRFYLSALLDGTTWDPLQYATKESVPDNIAAIMSDGHEEMWLFGDERSTEVWANNGQVQPMFPFQRNPNAIITHGCAATWSPAKFGNGMAWLAVDQDRGGVYAVSAQGYVPQRISTPAVENAWANYSKVSDAIGYTEKRKGHELYVITFPTAGATWAYDLQTGLWHRRSFYNGGSPTNSLIARQCYVPLGGTNTGIWYGGGGIAGDANIYTVLDSCFTDQGTSPTNGQQIVRIRQAPYVADRQFDVIHHRLRFLMQVGANVNLTPSLSWSDDGGNSWANPLTVTATAATNNSMATLEFGGAASGAGGLGVSPRGRIYQLTDTEAGDIALIDADIEVDSGRF
jgi:hypothetical protein